jgi:Fic family protein
MAAADTQKFTLYNRERMVNAIADHLADRSRGLSRSALIESMGMSDVDETTFYRWLNRAKEEGLVRMEGQGNQAVWVASENLRRAKAREMISRPLGKRSVVTYDQLWLQDYVPNKTTYLSSAELARLHDRCPLGSAPISEMDQHDLSLFLCGLPYGSSRMEGNSYDFLATVDLIERNMILKSASKAETQMILNHHQAVRYLIENIRFPGEYDDIRVSINSLKTIHSLLADNLLKNPSEAGVIRGSSVVIKYSSYKPLDGRESINGCLASIIEKAVQIEDPFEQAFFLTVHLPYLQPFVDCNKRTARVTCNIPLLRAGVVPMSWMDVDPKAFSDGLVSIYELNEPGLLAEVFVDGYLRSVERFNIMSHAREPDEVVLKYAPEIREAVRSRVLDGQEIVPNSVSAEDEGAFISRVEMELDQLRNYDEARMHRNKIKRGDIASWLELEAVGDGSIDRDRIASTG